MLLNSAIALAYKYLLKPLFFAQDPEKVHDNMTKLGSRLSKSQTMRKVTKKLLRYDHPVLTQTIDHIDFTNPIGLSAGFDYNGKLTNILYEVGFGFNTVGTVTALPYQGNPQPRLFRLPKSQSLLVNKGFKSLGVVQIQKSMQKTLLDQRVVGVSVGSTNIDQIDTIDKAINDYIETLNTLKDQNYIKYFEINISCPNTKLPESFSQIKNLKKLLAAISNLKIEKPLWLKLANEVPFDLLDQQVETAIDNGIGTIILSNLVKDRTNPYLDPQELRVVKELKGNFSGKPTEQNANLRIAHVFQKYANDIKIVGVGGVFNALDAYQKIKHGASLVQLITGMIYQGPQLISKINSDLVHFLKKDGFANIKQAVGSAIDKS